MPTKQHNAVCSLLCSTMPKSLRARRSSVIGIMLGSTLTLQHDAVNELRHFGLCPGKQAPTPCAVLWCSLAQQEGQMRPPTLTPTTSWSRRVASSAQAVHTLCT